MVSGCCGREFCTGGTGKLVVVGGTDDGCSEALFSVVDAFCVCEGREFVVDG